MTNGEAILPPKCIRVSQGPNYSKARRQFPVNDVKEGVSWLLTYLYVEPSESGKWLNDKDEDIMSIQSILALGQKLTAFNLVALHGSCHMRNK